MLLRMIQKVQSLIRQGEHGILIRLVIEHDNMVLEALVKGLKSKNVDVC